jgi:hypothetical protein
VFEQELEKLDELLLTSRISEEQFAAALAMTSATFAAATPEGQAYNDMLAEGQTITEAALLPAEEYAATVNRLAQLLDGGFISQETFNRSVEESAERLKEATDSSSELSGFLEQTSISFRTCLEFRRCTEANGCGSVVTTDFIRYIELRYRRNFRRVQRDCWRCWWGDNRAGYRWPSGSWPGINGKRARAGGVRTA